MDDITIRNAILEDLPVLLQFEQGIIKAERPFDPTIKQDPVSYYDIRAMILDDEVALIVAEYKGQIISSGYALAKPARHYLDHKYYAYLGFMYTNPDFRGMGANKSILDALKKWSLSKGLNEIRLTVYNDNIGAIKAYEKAGFKRHLIEMRLE